MTLCVNINYTLVNVIYYTALTFGDVLCIGVVHMFICLSHNSRMEDYKNFKFDWSILAHECNWQRCCLQTAEGHMGLLKLSIYVKATVIDYKVCSGPVDGF